MTELLLFHAVQVDAVLASVTFAPSCVDMGWEWETEQIDEAAPGYGGPVASLRGWLVRCSFQRPDRDTGKIERGFGRWWFVRVGESESGLVKTAYAAARMIVEHELMEAFRFKGIRIFDPHHSVDDLSMPHRARGGT